MIPQKCENKEIETIIWISKENQIADGLTKKVLVVKSWFRLFLARNEWYFCLYIYIYIYIYIALCFKTNLISVWTSHGFLVSLSDLAIIELLVFCRLLSWGQNGLHALGVTLLWRHYASFVKDFTFVKLVELNFFLLIVSWPGPLTRQNKKEE